VNFTVNFHPLAKADYHAFYHYIAERSPDGAVSWENALDDAISRLEKDPNIYSEIPDLVKGRDKYQQVFFKTRYGDRYRAVYVVDGEHVTVLRIRGKGQQPLGTNDLPNG